ncbi:MAG: glutathione S-transferase family protein [Myxococcota bacterium]|nr:glutathione S-transferase family protein [Myxococcota bacterium]
MDLILHHYPASPFSEKVRAMLGYLGAEWHSVEIPNIMPRPLLMPLTGGYRKTPTLQMGANVYCDTAVIAQGLARHCGDTTLYAPGFPAHRVAEWADGPLFRTAVTLNFRPEALAGFMGQLGDTDPGEFMKDRAQLTEGTTLMASSPAAAMASLDQALCQLEASLDAPFLFGETPSIADFSVYHGLWFLDANSVNAPLLDAFAGIRAWMGRIAGFGHGTVHESSGEAALAHARACEPALPAIQSRWPEGVAEGDRVTVTPTDYGKIAVAGSLLAWGPEEIVLDREDPEAGHVMTHFPSAGFEVAPA